VNFILKSWTTTKMSNNHPFIVPGLKINVDKGIILKDGILEWRQMIGA